MPTVIATRAHPLHLSSFRYPYSVVRKVQRRKLNERVFPLIQTSKLVPESRTTCYSKLTACSFFGGNLARACVSAFSPI